MKNTIEIPSIITANTYFWNSSTNASQRRSNERKRLSEVEDFFKSIGFCTRIEGDKVIATMESQKESIEATFHYSESCKNVYKNFSVTKNGKKSNISAIKKYI